MNAFISYNNILNTSNDKNNLLHILWSSEATNTRSSSSTNNNFIAATFAWSVVL